ncbi:TPA: type 4b pilus protein PilO2 [Serratia fonticola]
MTTHNSPVLLEYGKATAVAGLQWQAVPTGRRGLARLTCEKGRQVNRRVVCRGAQRQVAGFCALAGKTHRGSLYSLAMLALPALGRNGYGVVELGDGRQVFLATLDGGPAVMGDVVGSPSDIAAQLADFLAFNPDVDWCVVGTPAVPADWRSLLPAKPSASARLRTVHSHRPLLAGLLLAGVSVAGYVAWDQWRQAQDAADLAARRAAFEASQQQQITDPAVPVLPHPWAAQLPASAFLQQCQQAWQQAPLSIAGWILSGGECRSDGLRLGYDGSAGEPVDAFKARVDLLLGQQASFNLPAGGRSGEVFIALSHAASQLRDEVLPDADTQLLRLLTHLQRQGMATTFTEVAQIALAGLEPDAPPPLQEWREFTFTVSSTLPPATVFHPLADTGLRLARVTFTLTGGQLRYETEGHLYAYK